MALLIGTDEAGYGPNLGPLIVSASAWRVSNEALRRDLYDLLRECVSPEPVRPGQDLQVAIADSKTLYQPGGGLAGLELGVFTALRVLGLHVDRWRDIWRTLNPTSNCPLASAPWNDDYDAPLPIEVDTRLLDECGRILAAGLQQAGVQLAALRSVAVFPEEWNHLLEQHESKGAVLSHITLGLVRSLIPPSADEPVLVICDKHGGRNRYGPLLQHFFPETLVETHAEGRAVSIYRWGPATGRVEVRFAAKGETFLPSALASMVSKYLRELAMTAFNEFWRRHKPNLRPTAGYPVDAKRFMNEIGEVQQMLGIADSQIWRNR